MPDEAFDFIEILISEDYPYFTECNISITPFENIYGTRCKSVTQSSKKDLCNSVLSLIGTYPYYYIYNNVTNIIYLTHIKIDDYTRGMTVNNNSLINTSIFNDEFKDKIFICDEEANFDNSKITYYDKYKIEVPINNKNNKIVLKSMTDMIGNTIEQTQEEICSIYEETMKQAKPVQFPYGNFNELIQLQENAPIPLLFAHLYYKHNDTEEGSFEAIINECCDIIDDSLKPFCTNVLNKKISFGKCISSTQQLPIIYENCIITNDTNLYPEYITGFICSYSVKNDLIVSIYNTNSITKMDYKDTGYFMYLILPIIQFILLILWSFTQSGTEIKNIYIKNVGSYPYTSKKTFVASIISVIQLISCYVAITYQIENTDIELFMLIINASFSLIINLIFIDFKLVIKGIIAKISKIFHRGLINNNIVVYTHVNDSMNSNTFISLN
ncbi:hypothetical protein BCR32DRAFT_272423 [Anaeromyces robustus]|uniref:Uncharacterized protein n=1 Tax=Anaeromyces robustus TaxID=1754192 RepID=A0A1Y1W974_9FUNG|nr:hypothetical protein BCR32DRAFT_272423 [Anaeromyces robustus]|eukprot:ORX69806.1 hypothetical protein BCR32DRAFT_272423 [Anaeromyces robustus]